MRSMLDYCLQYVNTIQNAAIKMVRLKVSSQTVTLQIKEGHAEDAAP